MLIALSGYARSGKDTLAKALIKNHGFERVSFADKLREALYALNPQVGPNVLVADLHTSGSEGSIHFKNESAFLQDVIEEYGWDGYKETTYGAEIRRLLQRLGTETGRQVLGENIWVEAAFKGAQEEGVVKNLVVTDCRFPNEAQAVKDRGGYIVRIDRPGVNPANAHESETGLDRWAFDAYVYNNRDVAELWTTADQLVEHFRNPAATLYNV